MKIIISGSCILNIFQELPYFFPSPPFAALCFSSQSDLCLSSSRDASVLLLSNSSHGYKDAPCLSPTLPPPEVASAPLCPALKPGEGVSVLMGVCRWSSFQALGYLRFKTASRTLFRSRIPLCGEMVVVLMLLGLLFVRGGLHKVYGRMLQPLTNYTVPLCCPIGRVSVCSKTIHLSINVTETNCSSLLSKLFIITHTHTHWIYGWKTSPQTHTQIRKQYTVKAAGWIQTWMQALALQKDLFISLLKIDILLHRDMKSFWGANYSWAAVGNVCVCLCVHVCVILLFLPKVKPNYQRYHPSCEALSWGISALPLSLQQTGFYSALMIDPHLPPPPLPSFMVTGFKPTGAA